MPPKRQGSAAREGSRRSGGRQRRRVDVVVVDKEQKGKALADEEEEMGGEVDSLPPASSLQADEETRMAEDLVEEGPGSREKAREGEEEEEAEEQEEDEDEEEGSYEYEYDEEDGDGGGYLSMMDDSNSTNGGGESMPLRTWGGEGGGGILPYRILSQTDLAVQQKKLIGDAMELLNVEALHAKMLLRRYRWNLRELMDKFEEATHFLEEHRKAAVAAKAEVSAAAAAAATGGERKQKTGKCKGRGRGAAAAAEAAAAPNTFECQVCFEEKKGGREGEGMSLECGHVFCRDCVGQQFKTKVEEGETKNLTCLYPRCPQRYKEEKVLELLEKEDVEKYLKQDISLYVGDCQGGIKPCPGVDCGLYAQLQEGGGERGREGGRSSVVGSRAAATGGGGTAPVLVKCPGCRLKWCFTCSADPHFILACEYAMKWKERTADEAEMATLELLKTTSKPCPWCAAFVHRIEGCNFMRCKCGGYWCYKCSGRVEKNVGHTWNRIEGHECGREEVGSASGDDTKRFMFYLNQYRAQTFLNEDEARAKGAEREEMEDVALVNKARRALANSYVFAYYAFDSASSLSGTKLTLFQDKQQQLEQECEVFAAMLVDMHVPNLKRRPKALDVTSQRDKLRHWLQALHGTIIHDMIDDSCGVTIPDFDLDGI